MSVGSADLPIGQVAKRAGVGVQTVRYYERRGLLPPPRRRHSGRRIYDAHTVERLRAVKTAQRLGFTLVEIQAILRLASRQPGGSGVLQARLREKVLEIDAKIADLYALRQRLADALHAGCDSLTDCRCPARPPGVEPDEGGSLDGEHEPSEAAARRSVRGADRRRLLPAAAAGLPGQMPRELVVAVDPSRRRT